MKRFLVSAAFLGLAACGTPQQQCIYSVTPDLRAVDRLISETQGNLDRGYALGTDVVNMPEYVDCTPAPFKGHPHPQSRSCLIDEPQIISRPVAIDLDAEAAKLASLKAKRVKLAIQAQPAILACQKQYPEPSP